MAQLLVRHGSYTRLAFADELKAAVRRLNPLIASCCCYDDYRLAEALEDGGWEAAKEEPEVRRLLQEYGQAVREMDPEFWVRPVQARVRQGTEWNLPCVVADVRYPNEVDALKAEGAVIVRIDRPGAGAGAHAAHPSETSLDHLTPEHVIRNDGSLDQLRRQVCSLLTQLGG
ncbi:hypothetical protein [Streptomyces sp. NPDC045470]|uniref:deoxynucleotide monophosphate kinase family protein n=1 Tax=Streptomyces sp. NPDC045470 TaxID=3155469 RepID=UPI0033DF776A